MHTRRRRVIRLITLLLMLSGWVSAAPTVPELPGPALIPFDSPVPALARHFTDLQTLHLDDQPKAMLAKARAIRAWLQRESPEQRQWTLAAVVNEAVAHYEAGQARAAVQLLRQQIAAFERQGKIRGPVLLEPLETLARIEYARENFAMAADLAGRASFILRADKGLNSVQQLRYDDLLMASWLELGNKEALKKRQRLRRHVLANAKASPPAFLELVQDGLQWARLLDQRREQLHYLKLKLRLLSEIRGANDPVLADVLIEVADVYTRQLYDLAGDIDWFAQRHRLRDHTLAVRGGSDQEAQLRQLGDAVKQVLSAALQLQQLAGETVPPAETAETLALLGDNALALRSRRHANKYYRQSWELLEAAGDSLTQARLFGQPTLLYIPGFQSRNAEDWQGSSALELRVNRVGRPSGIAVTALHSESGTSLQTLRRKVRRMMKGGLFRPQLAQGEPVTAEAFRLHVTHSRTLQVRPTPLPREQVAILFPRNDG